MSEQVILALTSCPDEASARQIAAALVKERLATCVNRLGGLGSTYFWDGRLQDESETLLMIKTTAGRLDELGVRLKSLHPYELPELLAIPVAGGNEAYLEWVRQGVRDSVVGRAGRSGFSPTEDVGLKADPQESK